MSGSLRKKPAAASLEPTFSAHAVHTVKPKKRKRPPPLSLRLSKDERAELERLASGRSLSGKPPAEWEAPDGPREVAETLKTVDARIVFYNQLVDNAQQTYSDYLDEHIKVDKLWGIFKSIDDFSV